MKKSEKKGGAALIVGLLLCLKAFSWEVDTSLCSPGGIISVKCMADEGIVTGILYGDDRKLSSGEVFALAGDHRLLILPVPCDAEDPAGRVELLFKNGSRESVGVGFSSRDFTAEEIPLNGSMTSLRQSDDPRKVNESRRLWEILSSFNPDAVPSSAFILPVGGARESSHYGDRRIFLYSGGESSRSLHYGIDYAVPVGTPVKAPAAGTVILAVDRKLTGNSMVIEHGPGIYTLYYHLDKLMADEGSRVEQGEIIAESGITGLATGAHLHWELRVNGVPVDPLLFLNRPVVRIP